MSKLSSNQKDLKTKINYQIIDDKIYHYSLCKKEQNNFTLMSNWRLLIFNQDDSTLYYTNEPEKIPFVTQAVLVKPKKQAVYVNTSIVKNEPKTKLLSVSFNKTAQKDKLTGGQWKFQMETQALAKQWALLIKNKKEEKTAKALGISKENASNVNDLLAFGLFSNQKVQQPTPQNNPPPVKPITQSQRVVEQNKTELNKSAISKSVISKNESNVLNNISINKTQPIQKNNNQNSVVNEDWNRTSYKKIDPVMPSKTEREESMLFNYAMQNTKRSGVKPTSNQERRPSNQQLNATNVEYHKYETPQSPSPYLKPNTQRPKISEVKRPQSNKPTQSQQLRSNVQNSNLIKVSPINNQPEIKKPVTNNISQRPKASKVGSNVDWNRQFIDEHNQKTIQQFSQFALQTWLQIGPQNLSLRADSQSKDEQNQPQCMQRNKIIYYMAEYGTKAARKLKRQFNNYHYILQSIRENTFINVPLCCIIEYVGIVCLVKAKLPESAIAVQNLTQNNPASIQVAQQLRTLELYTKISNQSIKKSSIIYDLSKQYGNAGSCMRLYIDDLIEYLPYNPESIPSQQFQVRSKLILGNFSKTINPRLEQAKQQIQQHLNIQVSQLSDVLSDHKVAIVNYHDLKQLMHKYGLNTKMLPKLYLLTKSRFVKKFLHTAMFARVIKSDILRTVSDFRQTKQIENLPRIIQQSIRIFCENKSNQQDQVFKNSAQEFKKRYRLAFNIHQIQPGFLLSTLMTMISAEYDLSKIDKTKKFFEDANIISKGFLVQLKPKLKTYNNFSTEKTERVLNSCRSNKNQIPEIKNIISLKPDEINLFKDDKDKLYSYLSSYISPFALQHPELRKIIYQKVNSQPPTLSSHQITLNYANFCLEQQRIDEYRKVIQGSIDILSYWLGEDHPLQCDIFESLSNYYEKKGNSEDSINFMKQALTTCIRSTGTHTEKAGSQYFKLAEKQLKHGEKQEAINNFYKAQLNMEGLSEQTAEYTILLMRVSSIELSEGNIDKSIGLAIKAIKSSQNKNISDTIIVKIYEVLCRAYQLNCSKQQMNNLAHLTAKVFNQTQNDYTYDQMIRISLIGFIMTLLPLKQEKLQEYIKLLQAAGLTQTNAKDSLHRLMAYSSESIIMQKISKSLNNIEKYVSQIKSGRNLTTQLKQVKWLFQLVIGAVGVDFIEGVLNQAKYW